MRFSPHIAGAGAAGLIAAAGLCLVPGCGSGARQATPINTGLDHLAVGDPAPDPADLPDPLALSPAQEELLRLSEESAANLQSLFDQLNRPSLSAAEPLATSHEPASPPLQPPAHHRTPPQVDLAAARSPQPTPFEDPGHFDDPAPTRVAATSPDEPPVETPPRERPLQERIREHTIVLVDLLRQQSNTDPAPLRPFLALAAMEVLWPGALQQVITPDSSSGGLPPDQQAAVSAFRDFAAGVYALPQNPGSAIDGLLELAERLAASRPMRIQTTALCSRVTGYGQYTPLNTARFLHGRNQPVIIYTEIASFAHRPAVGPEVARIAGGAEPEDDTRFWSVEVSQEVQIFHDADGLLVWSRPEQTVVETSRNRRRDFFLVNEIVLPRSLSVGRYQMKIIMRDKTSSAVDESILSFEVVADPALARAPADRP